MARARDDSKTSFCLYTKLFLEPPFPFRDFIFQVASRIRRSLRGWSAAQRRRVSVDTKTTRVLSLLAETNGLLVEITAAIYQRSLVCEAPCSILDIVPNPSNNQ